MVAISFQSPFVHSVRDSRPIASDNRIRVMIYSPNDVFKYTGYYGYQANIEFASDEQIESVSMGDSTSWQIVPSGNRMFIKPTESDATTNMTVMTNKRTYYFELYAENAENIRDPNMSFSVKFLYPDDSLDEFGMSNYSNNDLNPDLEHPETLNFHYTMSGSEEIAPIEVFDDGEFTYLQFRDHNATLPGVFSVNHELQEAMVNYHMSNSVNNLLIIEHVYPKLALRAGKKVTCVFNEMFIDQ